MGSRGEYREDVGKARGNKGWQSRGSEERGIRGNDGRGTRRSNGN